MTKNHSSSLARFFATMTLTCTIACFVFFNSSFTQLNDPPKIKSRFYTMLLEKRVIDSLKALDPAKFDHFVFQCVNNEKDGILKRRRVFMLVVYACKADGTPINTYPVQLKVSEGDPVKEATDREEKINLASYKLTKKQYDTITKTTANFYALKFEAVKSNDIHSHKNYITYYVSVLNTKADDKKTTIRPFVDENYLKPSPPARPEP